MFLGVFYGNLVSFTGLLLEMSGQMGDEKKPQFDCELTKPGGLSRGGIIPRFFRQLKSPLGGVLGSTVWIW